MKTRRDSVIGILPRENTDTLHGCGEDREKGDSEIGPRSDFKQWESSVCRLKLHLRISTECRERHHPRGRGTSRCKDPGSGVEEDTVTGGWSEVSVEMERGGVETEERVIETEP